MAPTLRAFLVWTVTAALSAPSAAFAAGRPEYVRLDSPWRDYTAEVPAGWAVNPFPEGAMREVMVLGESAPGKSRRTSLDVAFYPAGYASMPTAEDFIRKISAANAVLRTKAGKVRGATLGGLPASRFEVSSVLSLPEGSPSARATPVKDAYAVLETASGYYVLGYSATESQYKRFLPAFERLLKTFRLSETKGP